jgi:HD-GYP domain-containing protein (c-di-GMP phosphodiesterase class II)
LYEPKLVDVFVREARALAASLDVPSLWDAVIAAEPGAPEVLEGERLEAALRAMAGFADLPCRWTRGHSASVASLAESAARQLGLEAEVSVGLRHAGYVHDLGRVGVTSSIWEKTGPLTDGERERVRMHSYFTERMLAKPASLSALGAVASLDHERLDGSGYHRRLQATALPLPARVLAAADVYAALVDARPHRPAFSASQAAVMLEDEARAGRLDGPAVAAVLGAAGHAASIRRIVTPPNGLSEREVEVLCLVAVGMTNKEVAQRLGISDRTVGHHLQHVYDKLGVSTRAAAALFAQQRGLVGPGASPHEG